MKKVEVLQQLNEMKKLLSDDSRWTKLFYARDANGDSVSPRSDEATCWCISGAIMKVLDCETMVRTGSLLNSSLYNILRGQNELLSDFNDCPTTDHSDVMSFIDDAMVRLEENDEKTMNYVA